MKRFVIAYLASGVVFIATDLLWLTLVMSKLFKAQMPQLILEQPKLLPAAVFYVLYPIGIAVFGVLPAQDWVRAVAMSALFGLLAYVTYEMTNLATLKGWSAQIAIMDIAWGAALSGLAGLAGYLAVRTWSSP